MVYSTVKLAQLSPAQISRLLNGHAVRVKLGNAHSIKASAEQVKKLVKAHKKGSGCTLTFDPYQQDGHQSLRGEGLKSTLKKGFKKLVKAGKKHIKTHVVPQAKEWMQQQAATYVPQAEAFVRQKASAVSDKARQRLEDELHQAQQFAASKFQQGNQYFDDKLGLPSQMTELDWEGFGQFLKKTFSKKNMKTVGKVLKPIAKVVARPLLSTVLAPVGMSSLADPIATMAGVGVQRRGRPRKGGAMRPAGGALHPAGLYYR